MTLEQCEKGIKLTGRYVSKEFEKYSFSFKNQSAKGELEPFRGCCGYYYYYFNRWERNLENALACLNLFNVYLSQYASLNGVEIPENIQAYLDEAKAFVKSAGKDYMSKIMNIMANKTIQSKAIPCTFGYYAIMSHTEIPYDKRIAMVENDSSDWKTDKKFDMELYSAEILSVLVGSANNAVED